MRDAREHQAGSKERFAKRIIAAIAAVAMLGGVGYATATTAVAEEAVAPWRRSRLWVPPLEVNGPFSMMHA